MMTNKTKTKFRNKNPIKFNVSKIFDFFNIIISH